LKRNWEIHSSAYFSVHCFLQAEGQHIQDVSLLFFNMCYYKPFFEGSCI